MLKHIALALTSVLLRVSSLIMINMTDITTPAAAEEVVASPVVAETAAPVAPEAEAAPAEVAAPAAEETK
jgi:hypothetical protein